MVLRAHESAGFLDGQHSGSRGKKRIFFASAHSIVDFSNGASVATLDVLQTLVPLGFDCQAFCTSKLDFQQEVRFEELIEASRDPYQIRDSLCGTEKARVLYTKRRRLPITVIQLDSTRHTQYGPGESEAVLGFFQKFLDTFAPDVMITYGGDSTTQGMIRLAKTHGVPVVFMIHNFGYSTSQSFLNVDYCLVASEFARRHYRDRVGIACQALPYPVDWDRVRVGDHSPRFVTFVNPCLEKGVYAFARIADELGRRRPDIPLLVVESRGTRDTLAACGIDPNAHRNIEFMPHTTDCKQFWSVTRIALLPSLWWENQPLVAIEAMINGIPVIGSNRGGIPETLGKSGFVLPLPERLTQASQILPTAQEVEPWVETIIRLWDDQDLYREQSALAKIEAERWHPDRIRPMYAKFFSDVRVQDGPPLVSREQGEGGSKNGRQPSCLETTRQDAAAVSASSVLPRNSAVVPTPLTPAIVGWVQPTNPRAAMPVGFTDPTECVPTPAGRIVGERTPDSSTAVVPTPLTPAIVGWVQPTNPRAAMPVGFTHPTKSVPTPAGRTVGERSPDSGTAVVPTLLPPVGKHIPTDSAANVARSLAIGGSVDAVLKERAPPMTPNTNHGLTSVIIPCWNQLEFTRYCISALMRLTRQPWELLVIDNGSTDGTRDYLAGVQDASSMPVVVIANETNRGFPAAINQGLHLARGEYLVLLNNDVVVTDGWLEQLIGLASASNSVPKSQVSNLKSQSLNLKSQISSLESQEETSWLGDAGIGLVGPMSDYAAPPQLVENAPYHDLNDMKAFAQRWRAEHRGKWFTVPKLSGFCLLMKRAVYDAIGGLDERFGLGLFDDDDLAERARRAGFALAVAHDLFVHHFGSRTFVGNGIDTERVLDENAAKFAAKWGDSSPRGKRVALKAFPAGPQRRRIKSNGSGPKNGHVASNGAPDGQATSEAGPPLAIAELDRARVSLTMIVRDERNNLPRCLESVRGLFDEIVVLDTGSKDDTVEIARSFGARVFDFVWVDDFAAARNAALARATGDYAFWLDADDLIEPPERKKLEALLAGLRGPASRRREADTDEHANPTDNGAAAPPTAYRLPPTAYSKPPAAYVVRCACDPGPDGTGGDTVVDYIRLFPLIDGVRWTYRVHEQILPALKRAGVRVQWTDITVRHTGYADRALRARKLERDTRILREELADRPDDPFTLFNLGSIAIEHAEWRDALGYLKHSLAGSAPTDSIVRKLFALIARTFQMQGDFPAALKSCAEGLSLDPEDAELWFRKAIVHRHGGQPGEAEECWRKILTLSRPEKFASMDQGIYGHLTLRNLAVLAKERGDLEEAERLWRAVLAECPGDREALSHLGGPAAGGRQAV